MRFALLVLLIAVGSTTTAQTRISPPPAKINLAEVGKMDKPKVKKLKSQDRFKEQKSKVIESQLRKHSGLSKEEIASYTVMVKSLDSMEMESLHKNLEEVIAKQDGEYAEKYKRLKKDKGKADKWRDKAKKYRKDSLLSKRQRPSLGSNATALVKDSLRTVADRELRGVSFDSLNSMTVDTTALLNEINSKAKLNIDSSYLAYRPSLDSLKADSAFYASTENKVEAFMRSFANERIQAQRWDLPVAEEAQQSQMQQFIPEFEKFDYQKPEIPEEKLTEALIEKEKERRMDEFKESIVPKLQRGETKREVDWVDRWQVGGFVEYKPENNLIELTPTLAYGVSKKITVGVGYSTVIFLEKNPAIDKINVYRGYLDYLLFRSFYFHLESEWKNVRRPEETNLNERSTLIGLGRNFRFRSITTSILGLYNLSAPNEIDTRRFSVRFAVNFNL